MKQAGEIVSDKGATVVLDGRTMRSAISPAIRRSRSQSSVPGGLVPGSSRCVTASTSGPRGVLVAEGCRRGLHRHRNVQHAAADASAGRGRTGGRQQSDCHRVPSDGPAPIVLDMATSEAAMGKIRMAEKAGERDSRHLGGEGRRRATTDPAEAIAGLLLPAADRKASGSPF